MRSWKRPTAWFVPFALCTSWGLTHCSSSSSSVAKDAGAKVGSGEELDASGGTLSGDDATADGGGAITPTGDASIPVGTAAPDSGDAGPVGPTGTPVPEGGAPSDPGSVPCNGAPCSVSTGYSCCVTTSADGGPAETCNPPNTGCTGLTIFCNEAADCNGGVCCQQINGIAVPGSTSCTSGTACPGIGTQTFQTCRTSGECGGAADAGGIPRQCIPQTCMNAVPMRTLSIEACAVSQGVGDTTGGPLAYCTAN